MGVLTINNGETGLVVRGKLNDMFSELYDNNIIIEFSTDGTSFHNDYESTDIYFRISRDQGVTWGNSIPINSPPTMPNVVFTITMPSAISVAQRCAGATEGTDYPTGWSIAQGTSEVDLIVTHNLGRLPASVTVWSETSGQYRYLIGNAAYSGLFAESNNALIIESLATVLKPIKIQIIFAQ